MVLTVCSQESSMATHYVYIHFIFWHHLLICRHSFRQPVWLIQVKFDAFAQQVLLHEPTFREHTHTLALLIPIFTGGSEIMPFSYVDPLLPEWTFVAASVTVIVICLFSSWHLHKSKSTSVS